MPDGTGSTEGRLARRESELDATWPEGLSGSIRVSGRAQDLTAGGHGGSDRRESGSLEAVLEPTPSFRVLSLETEPSFDASRARGDVTAGIMGRLRDADPPPAPLVAELLGDLPRLVIVAQAAYTRNGMQPPPGAAFASRPINVCAGWVPQSSLAVFVEATGTLPSLELPALPDEEYTNGPDGVDPHPVVAGVGIRRLRRGAAYADGDGGLTIEGLHRDIYLSANEPALGIHGFELTMHVDAAGTVMAVEPHASVVPSSTCVSALASAERLVGCHVAAIDDLVRTTFRGPTICTHLSDLARWASRLASTLTPPTDSSSQGAARLT